MPLTRTFLAVAAAVLSSAFACSGPEPKRQAAGSTSTTSSSAPVQTATWRPLPDPPIEGRIAAGVVWTGQEMLVWGGVARSGNPAPVADGAAYNPTANTWRPLAAAPPGVLGGAADGTAWTGKEAVFWAGNSPDGPAAGAVYEPGSDTWRRLPDGPLGPRESHVSVWTGKEMLLIGGHTGDRLSTPIGGAVNPATGKWRLLATLNALKGFTPTAAVWNGHEVFLPGTTSLCPERGSACTEYRPTFVAYDPAADRVREIDLTRAPFDPAKTTLLTVEWVGSEAVFAAYGERRLVRYDPTSDTWRQGPPPPCPPAHAGYEQAALAGSRWILPCGENEVQIFDIPTDTWQKTAVNGTSFIARRAGSAIAWTGTELIVWSGTEPRPRNPTPNDGSALRFPK